MLSDVDQIRYEDSKNKHFSTLAKYKEMWIKGAEQWIQTRPTREFTFGTFVYEDDVIFDHDEEVHGSQRCELLDEWAKEIAQAKKGKMDQSTASMYNWMKDHATRPFWERRFEQLMAENLINMPDDYYEDTVPFENTERLNQIFTDLEEENLGKINSLQEKH